MLGRLVLASALATLMAPIGAGQASAWSVAAETESAGAGSGAAPIAECPAGRKVLGGGIRGSGGFNSSETVGIRSADGADAGSAIDDAWQGFLAAFDPIDVTTYAICRNGSVARRHKSIDFLAPGDKATKSVSCPRGYRVTGGGVTSPDDIEVKGSHPANDGRAWEGAVLNVGVATDWGISAFCVNGPFAKHLVYKTSSDTAEAGQGEEDYIDCYHHALVGGGVSITGRRGSNLRSTYPEGTDTWINDVDAVGLGPVSFKTYAICYKQRGAAAT